VNYVSGAKGAGGGHNDAGGGVQRSRRGSATMPAERVPAPGLFVVGVGCDGKQPALDVVREGTGGVEQL